MQKKKKSRPHRNTRKKPLKRPSVPKKIQGHRTNSEHATNDSQDIDQRFTPSYAPTFMGTKWRDDEMKSIEDFTPEFKIHTKSKIIDEDITPLLKKAFDAAAIFVTREYLDLRMDDLPAKIDMGVAGFIFRNINKVLLMEDSAKGWIPSFIVADKFGKWNLVDLVPGDENVKPTREEAMETIVTALRDFMLEDGKVFPEVSIQQRVFLFDEAMIVIPSEQLQKTRRNVRTNMPVSSVLKMLDNDFRQLRNSIDGELTNEQFQNLSDNHWDCLTGWASMLILFGIKEWPYNEQKISELKINE